MSLEQYLGAMDRMDRGSLFMEVTHGHEVILENFFNTGPFSWFVLESLEIKFLAKGPIFEWRMEISFFLIRFL